MSAFIAATADPSELQQTNWDTQAASIGRKTAADLRYGTPPPQLVDPFLTPEGSTVIYARGGTGKGVTASWLAKHLVAAGTQEALRRISDPSTKAGELTQLLKVAADQYALLNGGFTERTASVNVNADLEPYQSRWGTPELRDSPSAGWRRSRARPTRTLRMFGPTNVSAERRGEVPP